jgi:hypothetical protein
MNVNEIKTIGRLDDECLKISASVLLATTDQEFTSLENDIRLLSAKMDEFEKSGPYHYHKKSILRDCRASLWEAQKNIKKYQEEIL